MKIALCGKMRSGKDSVAEHLEAKYDFKNFKLSSGITEIINQYFPETRRTGKPREFYQLIGQTFRELDQDVWIKKTQRDIYRYMSRYDAKSNILISDLRQQNEYEYLKKNGYIIVKVEADDDLRMNRILESNDVFNKDEFYHETEMSVDTIEADYVIKNNGTLIELYHKIGKMMIPHLLKEIEEKTT